MQTPQPIKRARPAARPAAKIPAAPVAAAEVSYVAVLGEDRALSPLAGDLAEVLSAVEVKAVKSSKNALARSLVELRGYDREDLDAIAEIGVQYLHAGALVIARTVFEGLTAIDPTSAYYAMALGIVYEREGDNDRALASYHRAIELDPSEGRAEVNAAELLIARGELKNAGALLARAVKTSAARRDKALENKARALYEHVAALASKRSTR